MDPTESDLLPPQPFARARGCPGRTPRLNLKTRAPPSSQCMQARAALYLPGGKVARMLSRNPTVLVVNDTAFAHGGLLPIHGAALLPGARAGGAGRSSSPAAATSQMSDRSPQERSSRLKTACQQQHANAIQTLAPCNTIHKPQCNTASSR